MKKRWQIKLVEHDQQTLRFGQIVNLGSCQFVTMHRASQARRCSYCGKAIDRGQPYLRFYSIRNPETGLDDFDNRCLKCPLPYQIEYVLIVDETTL